MANTYTQIYIHVVFAAQGRQNLIRPEHKDELQKYMTGTVTNLGSKLIAINNMPDHFHLLIGLKPDMSLCELVGKVKSGSSGFNAAPMGLCDFIEHPSTTIPRLRRFCGARPT